MKYTGVFYDYPDTQWIVIAAVGLSLIFQGLFYIYFFCSFKRNYTRNLTLKSYRKQKFSLRNGSLSNDFEDGEMSTDEPDTRPSVSNKSLETRAESVRNQKQPDNFITKVHPEVSQIQKKKVNFGLNNT